MANETDTRKKPGRPAGSKNRNTGKGSRSQASGRSSSGEKEVKRSLDDPKAVSKHTRIDELQAQYDRDKRNIDVIWSITLFAVSLFLFFTVVLDTTGAFGATVHDICLGLFGIMAYVLPVMVMIFAILLLARKLQHIGVRTSLFSSLIFINMCILNSYRFIDEKNLVYGFRDIAQFYVDGVRNDGGGALGMELGSLLVKFFGKPGLLIIGGAVIIISIFLVANTPISRFFENISKKAERRRILNEMDRAEQAKVQMAVARTATPGADPYTGIVDRPASSVSSAKQVSSGSPRVSAASRSSAGSAVSSAPAATSRKNPDLEDTIVTPSESRSIWKSIVNGISKDESAPQNDLPVTGLDDKSLPAQKDNSVMELMNRDTLFGRIRKKITGQQDSSKPGLPEMDFSDTDDGDFGYPGPRSSRSSEVKSDMPAADDKHYGLGDPDEVGHSGSFGLDGHTSGTRGTGLDGVSWTAGNGAAAGIAMRREERKSRSADRSRSAAKGRSPKPSVNSSAGSSAGPDDPISSPGSTARVQAGETGVSSDEDIALAESFNAQLSDASYELPPVSLLKKGNSSGQMMSDYQLEEKANLLEKTLNDFGVDARVLTVTQGASVTRYEVQPATGVKVSSITRLADDIALNLRAKSIRIEAPIPGKAAVGIEVENDKPSPVLVRELIESEEFREAGSKIEFVVGKDISGNNIVADLKGMPHLLIAGATGSGKSVCINTIITSFLYKARPSELKMIMIDPKVVELANYNGIPHLLTPVVTDARKASRALAVAVEEMDKRYELFAREGVKDLESYNELMRANHEYAQCKPQVVIIIDELADLMMAAPSEVENSICRLAQKARAAGMHLIVATQRPSVDVVTGLIKANIPSRIAFSVASQIDSRTILDMAGAEKLLGKGDMLFSPVGSSKPYRVQGPFISDAETDKVIKFVKKEGGGPEYDEDLSSAIDNADKKGSSEPQDELTDDAIAFILKSRQASVSMLQRRFRIGYNRAARIIDEIEEKGIIGPSDGSRPRQVLLTEDEYYNGGAAAGEIEELSPQEKAAINAEVVGKPHMSLVSQRSGDDADAVKAEDDSSAEDYFNSLPENVRKQILSPDN